MNPSLRPSLGSLAALVAMAMPVAAKAQVMVSSIENLGLVNGSLNIDIDGNGANDFQLFANGTYARIDAIDGANRIFSNGAYVTVFAPGDIITPAAADATSSSFDSLTGGTGYVGVSFQRDGEAHAAWLHFDFTAAAVGNPWDGTLTAAAWESTASAGIAAGAAIPEPAHVATGFGLMAGLAAWFRRRRTAG